MSQETIREAKRIHIKDYKREDFVKQIENTGYCVIENVIPKVQLEALKKDLDYAIEEECKYHKSRDFTDFGMVLFCPQYGNSFMELLTNKMVIGPVEAVMGEACIVYSFQSTSLPPQKGNYASRIHNDCRITIPEDYITRFQILVALDDFTLESGATFVLPGSYKMQDEPSEEVFYNNAERLIMPAGSVWYAHSGTWHAASVNSTKNWRHGVTTVFCRSYMKQRYDIPRLMQDVDEESLPAKARQKLGFLAQVPASYDEYYAPPEKRKFRQELE